MSKKIGVTVPDGVYDELNEEADKQGRTPANLAAFIIEHHLMFYRYGATVQKVKSESRGVDDISSDGIKAILDFLQAIAKGEKPSISALLLTAKIAGVDPEDLAKVANLNGETYDNQPSKCR
ncbi:MAG: ribbon-helix-helix domain-containing protein [Dolichospermum sp.]